MRIPEMDGRTRQDIIQYIRTVSSAYVPEWRFDQENPDAGTALSFIYADLFTETIKRFNRVSEKSMIAFFNEINARLLPAIPSSGYVTFDLAGDVREGVPVQAGTQLSAEAEEAEGNLILETVNDVYVTPAKVSELFCTSGKNDWISLTYDSAKRKESGDTSPFYLFDLKGENLQEHVLYFAQDSALNIRQGAWIEIELVPYHKTQAPQELLECLLKEEIAEWEYLTEDGFRRFDGEKVQDGKLLFFKSERQDGFARRELFGQESFWIRCVVKDVRPFDTFELDQLRLTSMGADLRPDVITAVDTDQNLNECFPFGEKLSIYSDVYFAVEEALSKKGAAVTLNFTLNFIRIPIDLELTDPNINWKLIMKRSEFKPDREYDITIDEVIWEYYNGKGWARLFPDNDYNDVFSTVHGTMSQYRSLEFICPQDMEPILINSTESLYIRARVMKLNNAFKIKGNYISPLIEYPVFRYEYKNGPVLPDFLMTCNNLEERVYERGILLDRNAALRPFYRLPEEKTVLYLSFDIPPEGGPIKLLLPLTDAIPEKLPRLAWEYYGKKGWSPLNVVDETERLRKGGIVTIMGAWDFLPLELFERERYWIRVVDVKERYNDRSRPVQLPQLSEFHINATQARQVETRAAELFSPEPHQKNAECVLLYQGIQELTVWVNEIDSIGDQLPEKPDPDEMRIERDSTGALSAVWVKWRETADFALSGPEDRHYTVDRIRGIVRFSDGISGRIPPALLNEGDGVRIEYRTGGGKIGNLPAGAVNRTETAIGFVNQVTNPSIISGGCDQETVQEAARRSATALKHGYRAVTAGDYENLAMEATRNIWKTKCFSNCDSSGNRAPGFVTLVVLQKDFENGRAFFSSVKEQVTQYLSGHISGNLVDLERFQVVEPQFLEMCVKVELTVKDFNQVFWVREQVEKRLAEFIHPMTGNFDGGGWEIGTLPNETQILNCLKEIPRISFIKNVFVVAYTEGKFGRVEADLDNFKDRIYALPLSGRHEILITVEEGR